MALQCGIVGLPNVGKSTLFNCLSNAKAQAANFPFCTIEPNVGVITDMRQTDTCLEIDGQLALGKLRLEGQPQIELVDPRHAAMRPRRRRRTRWHKPLTPTAPSKVG